MSDIDFIIVGSGCSGAMAAQTLVESGAKVLMLDIGAEDDSYSNAIPPDDFETLRQKDTQQHRYFLGKHFESLEINKSGSGAQLTPPRKHIVKHVPELLSYISSSFVPVESLAFGGLGAAWGLGCCVYSEAEMKKCSLDTTEMHEAYETVARRIGISADDSDDASPYTIARIKNHLPALKIDECVYLLDNYKKKKERLRYEGFFMGRPALALLSTDYNNRKATTYDDMHFYRDAGNSAYRPGITINELKKKPNFHYQKNLLVLSFKDNAESAEVTTFNIETKERTVFHAKKLVLAAGALSTGRIVLRSFDSTEKISFLCNPYTYYPCLNPKLAGRKIMQHKTGMAQLSLFHDPDLKQDNVAMASIYSYRSLFLFRLLNEVPLNFKDAKEIMRFLLSGIVIMGIHHPDEFRNNRFLQRTNDSSTLSGDNFKMEYRISDEERKQLIEREKKFGWVMKKCGAYPLKRVEPPAGASIHYAGTLPFSREEKKFSLSPDGRLHGTKNVYVADSSGFTSLPAKGLTFSLMANAHVIAKKLCEKK